jgi:hypothetical protein
MEDKGQSHNSQGIPQTQMWFAEQVQVEIYKESHNSPAKEYVMGSSSLQLSGELLSFLRTNLQFYTKSNH